MADRTGGLAGDDLVRLSRLPVEVEHQLEGGGEPAGLRSQPTRSERGADAVVEDVVGMASEAIDAAEAY